MARRANPAAGTTETAEYEEHTPLTGGSSGILENAVTTVGGPPAVQKSAHPSPDAPVVHTKKYEVFGAGHAGKFVLMNGYKCIFRDGKVVDEKDYDIAALTEQGVSLREIGG